MVIDINTALREGEEIADVQPRTYEELFAYRERVLAWVSLTRTQLNLSAGVWPEVAEIDIRDTARSEVRRLLQADVAQRLNWLIALKAQH